MVSACMLQAGVEDVAIIACPDYSLFVHTFLRHMHFLRVTTEINATGSTGFNTQIEFSMPKEADLITDLIYVMSRPGIVADTSDGRCRSVYWTNSFGHAVILQETFHVGSQECQKLYGEYLEIAAEACASWCKSRHETIGTRKTIPGLKDDSRSDRRYHVRSNFWFTRETGYALPVATIAYQQIRVRIQTRPLREMLVFEGGSNGPLPFRVGQDQRVTENDLAMTAFVDQVFVTAEEREAILDNEAEYLIEDIQSNGSQSFNNSASGSNCALKVDLDTNHLIRDIYWTVQQECQNSAHNWFYWAGLDGLDPIVAADLRINNSSFFGKEFPAEHFRLNEWKGEKCLPKKYIYKKAFGFTSHGNPTGHVNFTKTHHNQLLLWLQPGLENVCINVWYKGWNCLRSSGGSLGKLFD